MGAVPVTVETSKKTFMEDREAEVRAGVGTAPGAVPTPEPVVVEMTADVRLLTGFVTLDAK